MTVEPTFVDRLTLAAERALAQKLLGLPRPLIARLCGGEHVVDGHRLDEQAQLLIALAKLIGQRKPWDIGVVRARKQLEMDGRVLAPLAPSMAWTLDRSLPGPGGALPVRVYVPHACAGASSSPALVYYHGGGFALGSIESHDAVCRVLADRARAIVVSVDYRLAPEHKFPAAVDDGVASFRWVRANASSLAIDPKRIAVGGDSAGGNLSAVICQEQKRSGLENAAFQLLLYPATDLSRSMRSHKLFERGYILDWELTGWYLDQYLRSPADVRDVRGSPILEKDLAGLPPAMVVVAGFDPLRDEGEAYAGALRDAGVKVSLRRDDGAFHGYVSVSGGLTLGMNALLAAGDAVREALTPGG